MKTKLAVLVGLVAATAAAGALAGATADPGVSDTEILIGGTAPLTGEASSAAAVARGAAAYFAYVNDGGGVHGRTIVYRYLDDSYEPARTVQAVRQLVEQDGAFALFNTLGTQNNLAVREYLNAAGVPHLFVASGLSVWGREGARYPWTIGYIPTYTAEGRVLGRHIAQTRPKARIAVLYQDDAYGRELLAGLRRGLGTKARRIAALAGYDPTGADVSSQVAQLRATRADTLMVFAFGKFAVQALIQAAKLGWRPQVYVNAVASSANLMTIADLAGAKKVTQGATAVVFGKDPSDPRWAKDAGIRLARQILTRYEPAANPKDGYYVAGMAVAFSLVDALRRAGRELTREGVMKAALSLNEKSNPFLIPGMVVKTSATDRFPLEQVALQRWTKGRWSIAGPLIAAKG